MANTSLFLEKFYYSKNVNNLVALTKITINGSEYNVYQ